MFVRQVALVSEVDDVDPSWLSRIAAALQKQVTRDFGPIWEVSATVDAFPKLEDVPVGYWPIMVVADVQDAAGVHLDKDGQPFALVEFGDSWSLTASHECLEMLADPQGNRLIAGPSPMEGQGRVEFLVEVCDPSEAEEFAYTVNDVLMSDFYTPRYFDPTKAAGVQYSFSGAITEPRQVLKGGYLSWHNPVDDHWFQANHFSAAMATRDLGKLTMKGQSLRAMVDAQTPQTKRLSHVAPEAPALTSAIHAFQGSEPATSSRAAGWRDQVERLKADANPIDFASLMG